MRGADEESHPSWEVLGCRQGSHGIMVEIWEHASTETELHATECPRRHGRLTSRAPKPCSCCLKHEALQMRTLGHTLHFARGLKKLCSFPPWKLEPAWHDATAEWLRTASPEQDHRATAETFLDKQIIDPWRVWTVVHHPGKVWTWNGILHHRAYNTSISHDFGLGEVQDPPHKFITHSMNISRVRRSMHVQ